MTTRPNIEELDRLHAAAAANIATLQRVPTPYREAVAVMCAYPELSAYIRQLEARIEKAATRCRQEIRARKMAGEDADGLDIVAANIAHRVLSDLGETP